MKHDSTLIDNDPPRWLLWLAFALVLAIVAWAFIPWWIMLAVYGLSAAIMLPMMAQAGRNG